MDGTILGKKYDIINGGGGGGQLTPATADTLGGIKIGAGLSVTEDGTASVNFPPAPEPYTLPKATAETLGGVKVGSGLSMNAETGVLSNSNPAVNYSTTEQKTGQKWIDGKDIYLKVFNLESPLSLTSQAWTDSGFDGTGIDTIVNAFGVDSNGTFFNFYAQSNFDSAGKIGFLQTRNTGVTITKFVLEYTKATT